MINSVILIRAADNISSGGTNASQSVNNLSNSLRGLASQMGGLGPAISIVETALREVWLVQQRRWRGALAANPENG